MADPITHLFLGAATVPSRPLWGAAFALLSDLPQLIAGIILRTTNIWKYWDTRIPQWVHTLHKWLHAPALPAALFFLTYFTPTYWDPTGVWHTVAVVNAWLNPMAVAWLTHNIADMFMHDWTAPLFPFIDESVSMGRTYHSVQNMRDNGTWFIVLLMVLGACILSCFRGAW